MNIDPTFNLRIRLSQNQVVYKTTPRSF